MQHHTQPGLQLLLTLMRAGRPFVWHATYWASGGSSSGPTKRTYVFENCRPFLQAWQVRGGGSDGWRQGW